MNKEFNLIEEPWICVKKTDQSISEVSLMTLFKNAHNYESLAGETKTQDFAVFRLLLSIMYTAFSRYDLDGDEVDVEEENVATDSWKTMWKNKKISMEPLEEYFSKWHDRFWLFDEEYPFFQCTAVKGRGNEISTAKMIGTLFESNNKGRLFSDRRRTGRILSYSEAARWLLHLNCFDDIAAKNPTPKRTWVGKLGLIAIKGDTLAETLLLNYQAGYDYSNITPEIPTWEQNNNISAFNRAINVPDNQAALLSIISRRTYLCRDERGVIGYYMAGGDYFDEEEVFRENMTLWRGYEEKKGMPKRYKPKLYNPSKMIWREFESIAAAEDEKEGKGRTSGAIEYIIRLREHGIIKSSFIKLITAAVIYDYKQATSLPVIDTISDSLTFHSKLLEEAGKECRAQVVKEIQKCDKASYYVGRLYKELQYSCGRKDKDGKTELSGEIDAKTLFYDMIDRPFRMWLAALDPDADPEESDSLIALEKEILSILIRLGNEFAGQLQMDAKTVFGRKDESGNTEASAAKALNFYMSNIRKIFTKAGEKDEQGR